MEEFSLGTVLSVTHGVLLCDIGDCYKILNFMTGDKLFTHQLPRAAKECAPALLRQHPFLSDIDVSDIDTTNYREKLAVLLAKHPNRLPVRPLGNGEHEFIDPLSELAEKVHPDKIIVIDSGEL